MGNEYATLEIDPATAAVLEQLARIWGVSKEEAVRRAVAEAKVSRVGSGNAERLVAFRELQRHLQMTPEKAAAWQAAIREGRR